MLSRLVMGVAFTLLAAPAVAADELAFVEREPGLPLPYGLAVDHGGYRDDDGRTWVAIRAEPAILDALPQHKVRARRPVPSGPPPKGVSLPEGSGRERLETAVAAAPRAGLSFLGTSRLGRDIVAAWFGEPPEAGAPALWVMGGHHGDEVAGYEAALWLAEELAWGDTVDPRVQATLDGRTVWVVPWVNPDGVMAGERYNELGIDLNRNYGFEWSGGLPWAGEAPFSEPETQALRQLGDQVRPAAGLALHSGAVNIGYVWNHTEAPAPDRDALLSVATDYASGCTTEDFYVTNGAAWYVTQGDSNDWAYGRYGTWEFTLELSKRKLIEPDDVEAMLLEHSEPLRAFVLQPLTEITVVDAQTGAPVEAWGRSADGQARWASPTSGRLAFAGALQEEVTVGALGYRSATASPGDTVRLEPDGVVLASASPAWIPPVRTSVQLPGQGRTRTLHKVGEEPVEIAVDVSGRGRLPGGQLRTGWWSLEDGRGTVFPRAVAVGAESATDWPETSAGARAYVLGPHRERVEVAVGEPGDPLPSGAVLVVDAGGERLLVEGMALSEGVVARGAGCASAPQTGHLALIWVSILVGWARRRPEEFR